MVIRLVCFCFLLPIEILNGGVIAHQVVLARKGLGGRRPAVRMSSMSRLATHIGGWCVIKPFRLSNCLQNVCRRPTCRFSKPPKLSPNAKRQRTSNTSRTRLRTFGFGMCRQSVTVVLAVKQVSTHSTYFVLIRNTTTEACGMLNAHWCVRRSRHLCCNAVRIFRARHAKPKTTAHIIQCDKLGCVYGSRICVWLCVSVCPCVSIKWVTFEVHRKLLNLWAR